MRTGKAGSGLWKSGNLIRKAVSNKAIQDVAVKTTKVLLNSKATQTFVRKAKLNFFSKGWESIKQSDLSRQIGKTFKKLTKTYGIGDMPPMKFTQAKSKLSGFVNEIVSDTNPDGIDKGKFTDWFKDYQLNLRYNVGFMAQNCHLRRIIVSGTRDIVPETDFPSLDLANEMLGEIGSSVVAEGKALSLDQILSKPFVGRTGLQEDSLIRSEDYFLDPTSLKMAALMYNWEIRNKTAGIDEEKESIEGAKLDPGPDPDPDPELGQESILQLWTEPDCKSNDTVVACEIKKKKFNSSKFLPLSSFDSNQQADTLDPCWEGGCLNRGRIYEVIQPVAGRFKVSEFPDDEESLFFAKKSRATILGPLRGKPYSQMPEEAVELLHLQMQVDTLIQCRQHRIADANFQSWSQWFLYASAGIGILFLISVIISLTN